MPTGYTMIIDKGDPSFRDYALRCARAYGALIHMRHDSLEAEVTLPPKPVLVEHTFAKKRLAALLEMTDEEHALEQDAGQDSKYGEELAEQYTAIRKRYQNMLQKVQGWTPPTKEHVQLKRFMEEQLAVGCPTQRECDIAKSFSKPARVTRQEEIARCESMLLRRAQDHEEAMKRWNNACAWIQALLDSLEGC